MQVFAMVVVSSVRVKAPDAEEALKLLQGARAAGALCDNETMKHLIAGSVASSLRPVGLPDEADREASFSVYKTNNPASPDQPFLLVFRTDRIVTAH
jgi:hypothetical protein